MPRFAISSFPMQVRRAIRRPSLLIAALLLFAWLFPTSVLAQLDGSRRAALVVGNSDYRYKPLYVLGNPLNDARAMNSALSELDFDVTMVEDGDHARLDLLVERIAREFPEGGVGLIYFAGHGVQYKGVNYLLPIDFRLTTPSELPKNSLALNDVLQAMDRAGVNIGIVILDACRESPFGDMSDAFGQGLALVDAPGETLIAYATRPGGLAEDGFGANSPYTGALISALELPNQSIHEVFAAVRAKVSQATLGRQIPWVLGSLGPLGTRFKFRQVEAPLVAETLSPRDERITLASVQWNTIEQSVDPTDFEHFLMLHPQTSYASLAKRKLEALKAQGRENLPELEIRTTSGTAIPGGIDSLITQCDIVAADPRDAGALTDGVPWGLVNTRIAIRACVRSLADQPNSPRLLYNLGRALDIAERLEEAEAVYRKAADLGYAEAFGSLGYMYKTGRGRAPDTKEAVRLYVESALRGNAGAKTALGAMFRDGTGVPQSYEEAMRWFRLAAQAGSAGAPDAIATLYRKGQGVEKDLVESVRYSRVSAMLGNSNAMYNLGRAYLKGEGVDIDYEEAVAWFDRSTEKGNPYAAFYLGKMLRDEWGVERNYYESLRYFRLSADRGYPRAYSSLAEMYENGQGTKRDLKEAYFFYKLAIGSGQVRGGRDSMAVVSEAEQRLANLQSEIDPVSAARASSRAESWLEANRLYLRLSNKW
jgi:TPR repeat protein